jgi:hypothetical protein
VNEQDLIEKLHLIERLYSGAATEGEKDAAAHAYERIKKRLAEMERTEQPVKFKFTMADMWSRRLFVALMRRYGIKPYRYKRQRYTTVMAKAPPSFVRETLWPEFEKLNELLRNYLEEVTERVVTEAIFKDSSDAEVVEGEPKNLTG